MNKLIVDDTLYLSKGDIFLLNKGKNYDVNYLINKAKEKEPSLIISPLKNKEIKHINNMKKYKVCVYAICKNEEQFVEITNYFIEHYFNQPNYIRVNGKIYFAIYNVEKLTRELKFLVPDLQVEIISFQGEVLDINLPAKVALEITHTEPGVSGDTQTRALKDAICETGLLIKVPLFIEQNEKVWVKTEDGSYDSRAN